MKLIPLTQGQFAMIDNDDFEWLDQWQWHLSRDQRGQCYARRIVHVKGKECSIYMHRLILQKHGTPVPEDMQTDHTDGNGLNNQKSNLRTCSHSTNRANSRKYRFNHKGEVPSSKYKGVTWHKRDRCWQVQIRANGRNEHLGLFKNEEDAGKAYDRAAIEAFSNFARINFPARQKRVNIV